MLADMALVSYVLATWLAASIATSALVAVFLRGAAYRHSLAGYSVAGSSHAVDFTLA
jgi:hypothetical protein